MKHTALKTTLFRTLSAIILLTIGTLATQAQYYMNVVQKDGKIVQYLVSDIDNVYFSGQGEPGVNYKFVDLGLSVKWATCNVGAENPEDFGDYYAWGETETKDTYNWSTYKWCNGSSRTLTKYNTSTSYGIIDNKTVLDPEDDVAHVKWGGSWRMPTKAEQEELLNSCTWSWYSRGNTEFNGVAGYKVTSNKSGYTDRFIFLPAAGYRGGTSLDYAGGGGYYCLSSLKADDPYYTRNLYFSSGYHGASSNGRNCGQSVRPVCPSEEWLNAVSITINSNLDSIVMGNTITLSATVKHGNEVIDRGVTWSSDNPSIASVSETGVVTGNASGTTTITARCLDKTATCTVTVIQYEYVDLGLSVNWATRNVGASSLERYGDYYSWGETSVKSSYSWSNYKFCHGTDVTLTKYCTNGNFGYNGITDNKSKLDMDDDVAQVNWDVNWRMPTSSEFYELQRFCTWTWTTINGVKGYKIAGTKEGYTDRFIFLPAAGYFNGSTTIKAGSLGGYWSSSVVAGNPSNAWTLAFGGGGSVDSDHDVDMRNRSCGFSVRPVSPSSTWRGITSISLDESNMIVTEGNSCVLTAYLKSGDVDYSFFSDYYEQITWSSSNPSVATVDNQGMVTTQSIGSTVITATFNSFKADCVINVVSIYAPTGSEQSHSFVDLGLSVKWATVNVGANEKEDYGEYYTWGEDRFSYGSNKYYYNDYSNRLTKYCTISDYGNDGFTDYKVTLDPEDDVAHLKWGGSWRMPTKEEMDELFNKDNCTWSWTTINGVNGYCITSKKVGYERRSIFIPAAGYRAGSKLFYEGEQCVYWTSSLSMLEPRDPRYAAVLNIDKNGYGGNIMWRHYGLVVRPVCLFKAGDISRIELNKNVLNLPLHSEDLLSIIGKKTGNDNVQVEVNRWTSSNETVATVKNGLVTAVGEGSCVITAYLGSFKDTCVVTVKDLNSVEYDYVDLGLSVLWASFNVGAFSPEMNGNYYAWGETVPKSQYTWSNYKYCNGSNSTLTKYCIDSGKGNNGFTDYITTLDEVDDVAQVLWGGNWRMPTRFEFTELINKCTWTWTTQNGVNGCKVTSNVPGYTDRSIFLPATGWRNDMLNEAGSCGYYWSNSLSNSFTNSAYYLSCSNYGRSQSDRWRSQGFSVRPVCPSETWEGFTSIEIDNKYFSMAIAESLRLKVTSLKSNGVDYNFLLSSIKDQIIWTSSNESVATVDIDGMVKPLSLGVTTICAQYKNLKDSCIITVSDLYSATGSEQSFDYVDLGLSVKWATINVGASALEKYGDYYAWGEVETDSVYDWSTYKWCNGSSNTLTKYNTKSNNGTVDNKTVLDAEDDVAHVKWGGSWRMPTKEEQIELLNNCTWTWTTLNGVNGYRVTSKKPGYTDRSIFLPAAGYRGGTRLYSAGEGYYWSSSLDTDYQSYARYLHFYSGNYDANSPARYRGLSVRPVCP